MKSKISLFPMYSKNNTYNLKYTLKNYSFTYTDNRGNTIKLETEDLEGSDLLQKIVDVNGRWNPNDYNLIIHNSYYLDNCNRLFGEQGIAPKDSTIGFAIMWKSSDSKQRGIIPIGQFKYGKKEATFSLCHDLGVAKMRGIVKFTPVLYIKEEGRQFENEKFLANTYGTIIGAFDDYSICLDGKGSVFPIFEINDPGAPLWQLRCDWENPSEDSFDEYVQILLNTAHSDYKYLDVNNKEYNTALLKEIMASSLSLLILKLKYEYSSEWADIEIGNDLKPGSVSQAVYYFISALNWDVSKPENLSLSIRNYMDRRM